MCIGIVATNKMAGFVGGLGSEALSGVLTQLGGIQTYVTTMIVGYVLLMFLRMALRTPSRG
jgi:exfoliative toxin A/B